MPRVIVAMDTALASAARLFHSRFHARERGRSGDRHRISYDPKLMLRDDSLFGTFIHSRHRPGLVDGFAFIVIEPNRGLQRRIGFVYRIPSSDQLNGYGF